MKSLFINSSLSFLKKYQDYSEDDLEKLQYGLEGIYLSITKMIVIIALAVLLNMFKEIIILLLLFNVIRYFGFGIHARTSLECLITSLLLFIILPCIFLRTNIDYRLVNILSIIGIISFIPFAPADTVKRPFYNKRKIIIRKILTISIGVIYFVSSMYIKNKTLSLLLLTAIIIEAIVINPITYKIMKQPYGNAKK